MSENDLRNVACLGCYVVFNNDLFLSECNRNGAVIVNELVQNLNSSHLVLNHHLQQLWTVTHNMTKAKCKARVDNYCHESILSFLIVL